MHLSVDDFKGVITGCRSKESSGDPENRSHAIPSYRQCLVTTLLANEFLGLSIFAEKITTDANRTGYHYFNKDKNNIPIHFCEDQFVDEKILTRDKEKSLNKEMIAFLFERHPEVQQKYEILKRKFQEQLASVIR